MSTLNGAGAGDLVQRISVAVTSFCAAVVDAFDTAWTISELYAVDPESLSFTAVTGAMAMSSWSWRPLVPLGFNTPMTVHSAEPNLIEDPTAALGTA